MIADVELDLLERVREIWDIVSFAPLAARR